ncbi:MAG: flagellar motor protein MotB [Pseudomonadota bacterium]
MADAEQAVIIKRVKKVSGGGHHGGAWKVAYADFVTAMMAFFLLMWLLGATTEDQRKGIADYFNPSVPISQVSGGGRDMLNGETVFSQKTLARDGAGGSFTPLKQKPEGYDPRDSESPSDADHPGAKTTAEPTDEDGSPSGDSAETGDAEEDRKLGALEEDLLAKAMKEQADGLEAHIQTRVTPKGLVIELVEVDGSPLFQVGSTRPSPTMLRLLDVVASTVRLVTNKVEIVGHTDSLGFSNRRNYTNWELSSDRANVARRVMVAAGLEGEQIAAVTGKADTEPLTSDKQAPQNRRISITLLRN